MKMLHCIRSVDPEGGGPIEGVCQLAAAGAEWGQQHAVLSLDRPDAPCVAECPLPLHAVGARATHYGYSPAFVPRLRALAPDCDAVIVHGLWQYHAWGAWRALHGRPTPYVVYPHGMLDPWFKRTYPVKHLKKWLYWPWADYRLLRDARAILFTGEEERRCARQSFWLYRGRERVVRYGTAGITGDAAAQRAAFHAHFPQIAGKRLLLFLGRLHPKKGPDLPLAALARLRHELPRATFDQLHLVMAGTGPADYVATLRQLSARLGLEQVVTWTGHLRGDLKGGAFRSAEMFVLPSHQENFGLAVAEALSAGVPVLLGHGVNTWPEIVGDGAGIAAADTADGLTRLLRCWLQLSPAESAQMRQHAVACFQRRFHRRDAALSLLAVLQSL